MSIKSVLGNAARGLSRWLSDELIMLRLFRGMRGGIDSGLMQDLVRKANGTSEKECPLCGFVGYFKAFGSPPRWDAQCPSCGSVERHRQLALLLKNRPLLRSGDVVLHFAPEPAVAALLKKPGVEYVSADLSGKNVDLALNIESIEHDADWCDVIVCSHVLEHVNDKLALSELRRILKPTGVLIVMVPIVDGCEATYEDAAIVSEHDREVHFGQRDHVKVYGRDFAQRLTDAGFQFEVDTAFGREAVMYGLIMGEKVFLCRRANA